MDIGYRVIDVENWERRDLFKLYTGELRVVMNMTVDIDVTNVINYTRGRGIRFYPTMIWLVSKIMNSHEEYRYSLRENGELWCWDFVSPSYTDFNPETKKFVKFMTEYTPDFEEFYARVVADCEKHKWESGFIPNQPENFFDISCLPWTRYRSFDVQVACEGERLFPVVIWGKFEKVGDRYIMPVTMNYHHAAGDGYNLCQFFEELKAKIEKLGEYCGKN